MSAPDDNAPAGGPDLAEQTRQWIAADPDPSTRAELAALGDSELAERFSGALHFGTAGLRGPVRAGPAGMNLAVVTRATAAVGQWLIDHGFGGGIVVVGRDARHGSEAFFATATGVLAAQGFDVVGLPAPAPTPMVAFATRDLSAVAGIQITASHNPPADNGYKVYLEHGAQLVPPADAEIERLIIEAGPANEIPVTPVKSDERAHAVLDRYLARLRVRFPAAQRSLRIALTPMHGVGGAAAVAALEQAGFSDVHTVSAQFAPDPDFPTAAFPNPEEPGAADLLLSLAADVDADIATALDPDADRCAVGAHLDDDWRMLTGDETGALLGEFVLDSTTTADPLVANTIVSGSLLASVAKVAGARYARTLTGFKWLVRAGDGLVYAYEEAIGHCVDPDAVRDKDGISAAVALAEIAQQQKSTGLGLGDRLMDLHRKHGVHLTAQDSLRVAELAQTGDIMARLRAAPPTELLDTTVVASDYSTRSDGLRTDAVEFGGTRTDGIRLRVITRPSGTEPKLKSYLEIALPPSDVTPVEDQLSTARELLERLGGQVRELTR